MKTVAEHRPMKVLVISHYFWPETFRVNDLVAGLSERGHDVTVLTGIPNYPRGSFYEGYGVFRKRAETFAGAKIVRVPVIPRAGGRSWNLALNYCSAAFAKCVRVLALARESWDIVFVFQPSPITTAIPARLMRALCHAPVFLWIQDIWPETLSAVGAIRSPRALRIIARLVRWIYNGTDQILIQSEAFRDSVARLAPERADRIRYFPNFAEAFYRPVPAAITAGDPELPEGFRITFAGNIGVAQDFGTLLEAAELLRDDPEIRWIIAGDGRARLWVEAEIRARGLESCVHLIGQRPVESMPRLFARSDALIATLARDPIFALTIPSKIQSYLACGRPIVAALDGEGARVVAEAGAGVTCGAGDPASLAHIVRKLKRQSPAAREAMGQRGRAYFEANFERELLLDRLEAWFSEAAREGAVHHPAILAQAMHASAPTFQSESQSCS